MTSQLQLKIKTGQTLLFSYLKLSLEALVVVKLRDVLDEVLHRKGRRLVWKVNMRLASRLMLDVYKPTLGLLMLRLSYSLFLVTCCCCFYG